jgi:hypothetical protein
MPACYLFFLVLSFCILHHSYEIVSALNKEKQMVDGSIYYYLFNTLLFSLLVLHIYWWILMVGMVMAQIQAGGQVSDDVRSGKEHDFQTQICSFFYTQAQA